MTVWQGQEWDFVPTPHLFIISVSCCDASRTRLRRFSTKRARGGVRDAPLTRGWEEQRFGGQCCGYPGVAGEDGKAGIRCDTSSFTCSFR